MEDRVFDLFARPAADSRRTSLLARGGAGLAAVAAPAVAVAKKVGNTIGELGERQRERCRASFVERCQGSDDCLEAWLPCCEPFADCYGTAGIEWLDPN